MPWRDSTLKGATAKEYNQYRNVTIAPTTTANSIEPKSMAAWRQHSTSTYEEYIMKEFPMRMRDPVTRRLHHEPGAFAYVSCKCTTLMYIQDSYNVTFRSCAVILCYLNLQKRLIRVIQRCVKWSRWSMCSIYASSLLVAQ